MFTIAVENVNEALPVGMRQLFDCKIEETRFAKAHVFPGPVTTLYTKPRERVLFSPCRDANPFFHFMEALWMIAGRNDVKWISTYSSGIERFSDNGRTFQGAYGDRWRKHFVSVDYEQGVRMGDSERVEKPIDQVKVIIDLLKANKADRRTVMQMWDPTVDLGKEGKDFPCNTQIMFRISDGALDMTVINRSNDAIWGAYGANVVHMSFLQEFMANAIGVEVGGYWQFSNNFHGYVDVMEKHRGVVEEPSYDFYKPGLQVQVQPFPRIINTDYKTWMEELSVFMSEGPIVGFRDKFFRQVVTPIFVSWRAYKEKQFDVALDAIDNCRALDWHLACKMWLERRSPL